MTKEQIPLLTYQVQGPGIGQIEFIEAAHMCVGQSGGLQFYRPVENTWGGCTELFLIIAHGAWERVSLK